MAGVIEGPCKSNEKMVHEILPLQCKLVILYGILRIGGYCLRILLITSAPEDSFLEIWG
jgi:hypothetical protein